MKLLRSYYLSNDVVSLARNLIGKTIVTNIDGNFTGGIITETEAYAGISDKASHAFGGRKTTRTEIMYRQGGTAYVYLCYGVHALFNIVSGREEVPHAVLLRGIQASFGLEIMGRRMGRTNFNRGIINGPGRVSKALGIKTSHTGIDLLGNTIWLENHENTIDEESIIATTRIGIEYAGADALLPYRFHLKI